MIDSRHLEDTTRALIQQYGIEQVQQCLEALMKDRMSGHDPESSNQSARVLNRSTRPEVKRRSRPAAPNYVEKMPLPPEKRPGMTELARRFHCKSFLPTFGDIANFCQTYNIAEPASKSRSSAIPRVFKYIAAMEPDEIQRMLDEGMFSGPARLGPIADAIRSNGRGRATAPQV